MLFIAQAVLVGNLSQYFCEKNSLVKELKELRNINGNNTEVINSKEQQLKISTRNAYLYATGMTIIAIIISINIARTFFLSETLGMKHRILLIAAIYEKVRNTYICYYSNVCYT